jgi:hypothetical protein
MSETVQTFETGHYHMLAILHVVTIHGNIGLPSMIVYVNVSVVPGFLSKLISINQGINQSIVQSISKRSSSQFLPSLVSMYAAV